MVQKLEEKERAIQQLNERLVKSEYKHLFPFKNVQVQTETIKSKDKDCQTLKFQTTGIINDMKHALGRDLELDEVETALEEIKKQLSNRDSIVSPDDMRSTFTQSLRGKKPLFERID